MQAYEERLRIVENENLELRGEIKLLRQELHQLRENLTSLNNILSKFLWIISGGFIISGVTWILGGGFVK